MTSAPLTLAVEQEAALRAAGWVRVDQLQVGTDTVLVGDRLVTLTEMDDERSAAWLGLQLAVGRQIALAEAAGDAEKVLVCMQVANLQMVAMALNCSEQEAAELHASIRREIVRRQDVLNHTRLFLDAVAKAEEARRG